MENKKYYSISEVTKILKIHDYQLRYLEKISVNFAIHKIRGRRYYTSKDIDFLKNTLAQSAKNTSANKLDGSVKTLSKKTPARAVRNGQEFVHPHLLYSIRSDASHQSSYERLITQAEYVDKSFKPLTLYPVTNEVAIPKADILRIDPYKHYVIAAKVDCLITKFSQLSIKLKKIIAIT